MVSDRSLEQLVKCAADIAMRAAATYANTHNLQVDADQLVIALRQHVHKVLPEAITDAHDATTCGMGGWAATVFAASLAQAGIDAVDEVKK